MRGTATTRPLERVVSEHGSSPKHLNMDRCPTLKGTTVHSVGLIYFHGMRSYVSLATRKSKI